MRIGKQDNAVTGICESDAVSITVRGHDLCSEIIGRVDFTSYFWLLLTGVMPDARQKALADAALCAIAEHGLVPSVVAARMTYAAAPEAFQGAVAAGLLGCGSVVLGSAETAGRFYAGLVEQGGDPRAAALAAVRDLRASKQVVPGFGHPQHAAGDPRALRLFELARELGVAGAHCAMVDTIAEVLPEAIGRSLPVNVNGAIPAVLLDAGFPLAALKGISLLARTASLVAHLTEEVETPIGFILAGAAADRISFDAGSS